MEAEKGREGKGRRRRGREKRERQRGAPGSLTPISYSPRLDSSTCTKYSNGMIHIPFSSSPPLRDHPPPPVRQRPMATDEVPAERLVCSMMIDRSHSSTYRIHNSSFLGHDGVVVLGGSTRRKKTKKKHTDHFEVNFVRQTADDDDVCQGRWMGYLP